MNGLQLSLQLGQLDLRDQASRTPLWQSYPDFLLLRTTNGRVRGFL
jgi:hypothetical protein